MYIRSLAWVYCICQQVYWIYHQVYCTCHQESSYVHQEPHLGVLHLPSSVLHMPSSNIRSNTGVYYISHKVYCRGDVLLQEPHLGVLHILSCKSGAPTWCIVFANRLLHMPSCTCTSGALLGCTVFVSRCTGFTIKSTAEAIMYIMSLT